MTAKVGKQKDQSVGMAEVPTDWEEMEDGEEKPPDGGGRGSFLNQI